MQIVGNVKERHIRLINKLVLATGGYAGITEVQLIFNYILWFIMG